jgi:CHAD domain-containing protein
MDGPLGVKEPPAAGVRRAVAHHLGIAADALAGALPEPTRSPVHEARRSLKFARALLRLARDASAEPAGTEASIPEELDRLRDLGRDLSTFRDAEVLVETAEALVAFGLPDTGRWAPLVERLRARNRRVAEASGAEEIRARVIRGLRAATRRSPRAVPDALSVERVRTGLRRSHGRGREAMVQATGPGGTAADHHRWRKRVKDLRHQLELLEPLRPPEIPATAEELHHLGDLLGHANDLVVLQGVLEAEPGLLGGVADPGPLRAAGSARTADFWREATLLGRRLY